ncbi:MAG: exodeoxyribonuclease VII small subunit [Armatimonadota bacterium]
MAKEKVLTFEQQIERLEEIVCALDNSDLPLEDSLKLFEEGVSLTRKCSALLTEAQGKLEILTSAQGGALKTEGFEIDE